MKEKKMLFFVRMKNAITNFEGYKTFAEEKLSVSIKYFLKIILIFAVIVMTVLTYKIIVRMNDEIRIFNKTCPDFRIENNTLIIDNNKQFFKGDENKFFSILISDREDLKELENVNDYQIVVAALKDKLIIKNNNGIGSNIISYDELSSKYDINNFSKALIMDFLKGNNLIKIYILFACMGLVSLYITYLSKIILDVLLLSIVGYLFSRIINIKFKYKSVFNMSVYALTLSIVLNIIIMCIYLIKGFTIKYFEIAYNAISYIYIITAMLMIKSDLIKQQIEVGRIVEEQKKVRKEIEDKEGKDKQDKQDKQDDGKDKNEKKKKKDKKGKEKGESGTPEGSKA